MNDHDELHALLVEMADNIRVASNGACQSDEATANIIAMGIAVKAMINLSDRVQRLERAVASLQRPPRHSSHDN